MVSIVAFQAVDPGSIPGHRTFFFVVTQLVTNMDLQQILLISVKYILGLLDPENGGNILLIVVHVVPIYTTWYNNVTTSLLMSLASLFFIFFPFNIP